MAELLARLDDVRVALEGAVDDPEAATERLTELGELARELAVEVDRAREALRDGG